MSQKEKLLKRIQQRPRDFTYPELVSLLSHYGYKQYPTGNTSGSAVKFCHMKTKKIFSIHRPHPGNVLKRYVIDMVIELLKEDGVL